MRLSNAYIPTLKEAPADAELASHQLLVRAGMLRPLARGIYSLLPLGLRVQRKVERIIREELDRIGGQEVLLPVVQPAELWQASGRWQTYTAEGLLATLKDRHDREFCLGPTHEEVITDLVKRDVRSYRELPRLLYQIHTKFRDEIRPRFGLLRAREFTMFDAYSFDRDAASATAAYWRVYEAYERIFRRCGLSFVAVEALTGAMGGNLSHEFQVLAAGGENEIVQCHTCGYAANVEKASIGLREVAPIADAPVAPLERVPTPGAHTVDDVAAFLQVSPRQIVKTLLYVTDRGPVAALVRGDHSVNADKLRDALGVGSTELADAATVEQLTAAPVGFAGPVGMRGVRIIADRATASMTSFVTGANAADTHYRNVHLGRDFTIDLLADIRNATAGDPCPRCETGTFELSFGIEVGQVYYLGRRYSVPLDATFRAESGELEPFEMGCYGIGIGRTIASAVEQHHDAAGICWPMSIAPYEVALLASTTSDSSVVAAADRLYSDLSDAGVEVLYDDRPERAGVKFNDADLIGVPLQLVVGQRALAASEVELKRRSDGCVTRMPLASAVEGTASRVRAMRVATP